MATTFNDAMSRAPVTMFQWTCVAICMLVLVCDGMDAQLLGILAPLVIAEFGVDRGTFGIAMSAALIGFGIGSWGGGWLGDRIGRRWSLALATVFFSAATIGASWSGDVWQMAAWRLVGGLGFGSAYANAIALAGEWLPDRYRAVGVTTLSVGTPAGGLVVSALAPMMVAAFGWRGTFVAIGAATFLVVLLIVFVLRDSPAFLLARGRHVEARKVAGKIRMGELDLVPERQQDCDIPSSEGVFAKGNFRLNLGIGIAFAAATLVAYGILNWTTTFLTAKNFTFEQASYAVSVGGLTSIAASIAAGFVVQRYGSRIVMATLSALLVLSLIALAARVETLPVMPGAGERLEVVALIGLAGALFSGAIASFYALMTYAYPSSCRSAGIGFGIFVGRAGAIAATGLGGWLIEIGQGSLLPFFITLIMAATLVSAAAFVVDRHVEPASRRGAPPRPLKS